MRNNQKSHPIRLIDLSEQAVYRIRRFRIKITRRLVGQNHRRSVYQRPRNGHPLLLATGKFSRPVTHPFPKPDTLHQLPGPDLYFAPGSSSQQPWYYNIFQG